MHSLRLLALLALPIAIPACGDNLMQTGPDGPPAIDAGPEPPIIDAAAPDAWLAPPDAPVGEVCDYLPGTFEEIGNVSNYPVRFGKGQGLEISPDIRQTGLLELENAHIGNRDVIEKRRGAVQLGDSRSTTPGDVVPDADRRAIWARGDEVVLETHDAIYREQKAITTFTWSRVASWMRMRLRDFYANTFSGTVSSTDAAVIGDAMTVAYQEGANSSTFVVYGPSMAQEVTEVISATPTKLRLSSPEDNVVISYQNQVAGFPLVARTWTPGQGTTAAFATIFATMPAAAGVWDVHSAKTASGDLATAWAGATPTVADITVTMRLPGGLVGTTTANLGAVTIEDVSLAVWPVRTNGGTRIRVAVVVLLVSGGNQRVSASWQDFNATTGAFISGVGAITTLTDAASVGRAIAVSFIDRDTMSIAVEQDDGTSRKVSYFTANAAGALTSTGIVHRSTALKSQGAIVTGTPSDTPVASGGIALNPAFVEQLITGSTASPSSTQGAQRSGWILYAPRTGEIVARSFVGFTGDAFTRTSRPPKGSLIASGDVITWAGPAAVPSEPGTSLRAIAVCRLDRSARANKPAVLDDTVISAHGGYPRAYDGTRAFEHDWHLLPGILSVNTGLPGGTTTAGAHGIAVTFEADDANGLRYRSAPTFLSGSGTVTSGGVVGNSMIGVQIEPMSHTERANVRAVIWMTEAGLALYKRAAEAAVTGAIQTINVDIQDANLSDNEVLDQGPGSSGEGILPSEPARVTDFVALLIDRLASRDPRVGSLMTFTIPSREASGFAAHWSTSNVIQESLERNITSAIELHGRIFMASEGGFSELQGDGPDATGAGSFGTPLTRFVPIGIEDHSITERTPLGYAFGSLNGPRLLSLGGTVEHIDEAVERQYEIDGGHVVAIAYDENREEIVFLDDAAQTLRLNAHNGRWASDSDRLGRDITVTRSGDVYLIRSDGKVLRQSEDVYADGASGYSTTVAFRLRAPAKDGVAHGSFNFNGLEVFGEYLGSHAITVTVTLDFRDSDVILQGEVPAARVVANAAAGRDYRYAFYGDAKYCYAARCEVTLSSTTGQTARLDGIDVRYNVSTSGDPAQVQEDQRFTLDVVAS